MRGGCAALAGALTQRVAIVHHWDSDGVAAASLLARAALGAGGAVAKAAVPRIGRYSWKALPQPGGVDLVLVLDYGIPGSDYEAYASRLDVPVVVVDHHRVEPPRGGPGNLSYCNPVAQGRGGEADHPSAAMLLHGLLGRSGRGDSLLAALGTIGDLAPFYDASRPHPGLDAAASHAHRAGVDLRQLRELAERIDSCYRLLDEDCIAHAFRLATLDPFSLLGDRLLAEAREKASRLVEEAYQALRPLGRVCGFKAYYLEVDALVSSAVGRRLAAEEPGETVALIHYIPSQHGGFIYVRSLSSRLDWLHERARRRGHRAGGKTNVAVIEFDGSIEDALGLLESLCAESGSS